MVPVRNLYYLLAYAYDFAREGEAARQGDESFDGVADLLASLLADGARDLARRGLDRAYLAADGEIRGVKGKLDLGRTVTRQLDRVARSACAVDELSVDILHNRILRATLRRLSSAVGDKKLRDRVLSTVASLRDIDDAQVTAADFSRVAVHRNNRRYRFLLDLAELAWRHLAPRPGGEGYSFLDFRHDEQEMGSLFEAFVRNFIQREQPQWRVGRDAFPWSPSSAASPATEQVLPGMQTDIVLSRPGHRRLIEVKCYGEPMKPGKDGKRRLRSAHLYQVFAYLENLRRRPGKAVDDAVLLYAQSGVPFDHRFELAGHPVRAVTLCLDQPWAGVKADLVEIVGAAATHEHLALSAVS